jgi:hypothetical protein
MIFAQNTNVTPLEAVGNLVNTFFYDNGQGNKRGFMKITRKMVSMI